MPAIHGDWSGDLQAGGSIGAAFLATEALSAPFPKRGLTAATAAASLQNRYGWQVGLRMQAIAAFVGISRIEAQGGGAALTLRF